jgi:hypothetical protein
LIPPWLSSPEAVSQQRGGRIENRFSPRRGELRKDSFP